MKDEMVIYLILGFFICFSLAFWALSTKSIMNGVISIFAVIALGLFIGFVLNKVEKTNDRTLDKWGIIVLIISILIVLFLVIVGLMR